MKKQGRFFLTILGMGVCYLIWLRLTGIAIPCMFQKITGWLCPGCGITTLFLCLSKGDIQGAYEANVFLLMTGPFLLGYLLWHEWMKQRKKRIPSWNQGLLVGYIIALCVFGVLRNIGFESLN